MHSRKEGEPMSSTPSPIRFATIGLNHGHINEQTGVLLAAGGELVAVYAEEADLLAGYQDRFPQAKTASSKAEILEDESIQLVISAAIPSDRGPLGVDVMRHGKDYMSDKPAFTTMAQLEESKRVQQETGQIFSVFYSERLGNRASIKAGELVEAGAIGEVIQTIGLGPHQLRAGGRPEWFFQKEKYGGILIDIASHQFEQFLYFTGAKEAEIVAAQVGNYHHPQYPGLEDFGDTLLRADNGRTGYLRVDWFTPEGLGTWGDGRLTILGSEGYMEIRKYVDIAGRPGGNHVFLVNQEETRYIDAGETKITYGENLLNDVRNRTETAMPQAHCFLAMELALRAQEQATLIGKG
jgi:predicted dehydrogenase